jgi:DNA replication protein DnaC
MRVPIWKPQSVKRGDWLDANVPEGKWGASLEALPENIPGVASYRLKIQTYLAAMKENIEKGRGLLIFGPYRSGKSCLAALCCKEVLGHRCNAFWLEAFELVDGWRWKDNRYAGFRTAHLVVLDDLGTEAQSAGVDWPRSLIREAMRYRLERLMPVVVTTNMMPEEVQKVYGDKFVALIDEYLTPVLVKGAEGHWKAK